MNFPFSLRSTGRFAATILSMEQSLLEGREICVMQLKEDNYIDRIMKALKERGVDNVKYERVTSFEPRNNIQLQFDRFGEPIGVVVLPQVEKFLGWKIWRETLCKP